MKKIISIMLALALTLSLGVVAFADNGFEGNKNSLVASYSTDASYTVTIPADQPVSVEGTTGKVEASSVRLVDGKKLVVTMASTNGYKMTYAGSEIAYTVKDQNDDNKEFTGTGAQTVLEVAAGNTSGSTTLSFTTTTAQIGQATKAGEHTDILTFACSVNNGEM